MSRRATRLALLVALAGAAVAPVAGVEAPIELDSYNRTYTDLVGELEPFTVEPVEIRLRSPSQSLTVRSNRIRATPAPDGSISGRLELDIVGKGRLVAEVDLGGVRETFEDELILPPQTLVLVGRGRIERVDGGYRVRIEELPERISVAIQSRLAATVLNLCGSAELLTLGAVSCGGLEAALTRPSVPIPREAGEVYLADSDLDAADRAALDALAAASR